MESPRVSTLRSSPPKSPASVLPARSSEMTTRRQSSSRHLGRLVELEALILPLLSLSQRPHLHRVRQEAPHLLVPHWQRRRSQNWELQGGSEFLICPSLRLGAARQKLTSAFSFHGNRRPWSTRTSPRPSTSTGTTCRTPRCSALVARRITLSSSTTASSPLISCSSSSTTCGSLRFSPIDDSSAARDEAADERLLEIGWTRTLSTAADRSSSCTGATPTLAVLVLSATPLPPTVRRSSLARAGSELTSLLNRRRSRLHEGFAPPQA